MAHAKTFQWAGRFIAALATTVFLAPAAKTRAADAPAAAPPLSAIYAYHYHESPYPLEPGPHLCIDWRYVEPGWVSYTHEGQGVPMMEPGVAPPEIIPKMLATPLRAPFGVRLEMVPATKVGPVLKPEKPWEYFTPYTNLLHYEGKYLLYYNTTTFKTPYVTCRAESTDGVHFTKPDCGVIEFQGSKANNIVLAPGVCKYGIHGQGIFIDPSAPADERFKAVYTSDMPVPEEVIAKLKQERPESVSPVGEHSRSAVMGAVSPDGIHWRELPEPLLSHMSDTGSTAYYDARLKRYVAYLRMFMLGKRVVGRTETADFAVECPGDGSRRRPDRSALGRRLHQRQDALSRHGDHAPDVPHDLAAEHRLERRADGGERRRPAVELPARRQRRRAGAGRKLGRRLPVPRRGAGGTAGRPGGDAFCRFCPAAQVPAARSAGRGGPGRLAQGAQLARSSRRRSASSTRYP